VKLRRRQADDATSLDIVPLCHLFRQAGRKGVNPHNVCLLSHIYNITLSFAIDTFTLSAMLRQT